MRARVQRARFHGRWQYLFIESICNDPAVLEQNYRYKMMYSPDYAAASEHVWSGLSMTCPCMLQGGAHNSLACRPANAAVGPPSFRFCTTSCALQGSVRLMKRCCLQRLWLSAY